MHHQSKNGGGRYTVRSGDTLASVAQALWGDANLWYKLAQANGLGAESTLIEGQTLTIPAGVVRSANRATSTRPYDAADLLGDLSPTTPAPQATNGGARKNKCGAFGAILLIAVAVAVAVVATGGVVALAAGKTLGAGSGAMLGTAAGAGVSVGFGTGLAAVTIGAAGGSIASQGVGLATGLQDKFSWKSVGIAALTTFLGPVPVGNVAGSAFVGNVVGGALTSAAVQGVAIATGLQSKFDWAGAAAAGVGGAAARAVGSAFRASASGSALAVAGQGLASGVAGAIANAAARSLIQGTSFGDTILAALPEVIGQTIGNVVADAVSKSRFAHAGSGSRDAVAAGAAGGVGGVGDDAEADPSTSGVGGKKVGGTASGAALPGDIVIIANPQMRYLFDAMNDYQFGRYFAEYGQINFKQGAQWALGLPRVRTH